METSNKELETLQDIRNMMERSSRFISLSGWSGVAAGACALIGAYFAHKVISADVDFLQVGEFSDSLKIDLSVVAVVTFIAAFISAFFFTYFRSKKQHIPIWNSASKRLMWNVAIPMFAGGALVLKLIEMGIGGLIAPVCLIIYGITLFSGSKMTLDDIKYLGYSEMLLGIVALFFPGYGLYFWTVGFGLFHIVYGIYMWLKYERA